MCSYTLPGRWCWVLTLLFALTRAGVPTSPERRARVSETRTDRARARAARPPHMVGFIDTDLRVLGIGALSLAPPALFGAPRPSAPPPPPRGHRHLHLVRPLRCSFAASTKTTTATTTIARAPLRARLPPRVVLTVNITPHSDDRPRHSARSRTPTIFRDGCVFGGSIFGLRVGLTFWDFLGRSGSFGCRGSFFLNCRGGYRSPWV